MKTHKSAGDKFNYTEIKDAIVETMNEDIVIPEPVTNESAEEKIEIMKSAGITISKSPADIGKTLFQKLNG